MAFKVSKKIHFLRTTKGKRNTFRPSGFGVKPAAEPEKVKGSISKVYFSGGRLQVN
jgi:hypothetical protein